MNNFQIYNEFYVIINSFEQYETFVHIFIL